MSEQSGWHEEMQSAFLYRVVAEKEAGTPRRALFAGLADAAEKQAGMWLETARKQGRMPTETRYQPDLRTRIVADLIRLLGPRHMRPVLAAMKIRGLSIYSNAPISASPAGGAGEGATEDARHAMPTAATTGTMELRHRGLSSGGNLRATVFGVNDGLVSNASLIMGVAGATLDAARNNPSDMIVLSGFAGLLAGAFSMAAGEYISVRSQREMYEHQIGLEREELAEYPEEEAAELALIYEARGLSRPEAAKLAQAMIANPEQGLATLAREELGLNPEELGSPWGAAVFSFLAFSAGALIPLSPFLLLSVDQALYVTAAVTAISLFSVGATLSLFTGQAAVRGGLRMLFIGGAAGLLTFSIGKILGVNLS
ncbi:MAG: hypothetical protein EXQ56_11270 [Acidobacteria bacterium]|nr:hypothetical protein [Acidobacteriota bacterium]